MVCEMDPSINIGLVMAFYLGILTKTGFLLINVSEIWIKNKVCLQEN